MSLPQPIASLSYTTKGPGLYLYGKTTLSTVSPSLVHLAEGLTTFFLVLFVAITALRIYARTRLLESGFRLDDGMFTKLHGCPHILLLNANKECGALQGYFAYQRYFHQSLLYDEL